MDEVNDAVSEPVFEKEGEDLKVTEEKVVVYSPEYMQMKIDIHQANIDEQIREKEYWEKLLVEYEKLGI